ncbi:Signal transduction histidine kinase [Friedmanniella luteola]|uniref:histidine kinase n=1 Tax=Friedmanniella luteola TaxID=546871 RepID=A0A1H1VDN7_9ACTN|nr:sensor histidine kinase [Friedmanniella luteola]SDS82803.1 Signal transduction histidine kinase [Friedmanniella luteola]
MSADRREALRVVPPTRARLVDLFLAVVSGYAAWLLASEITQALPPATRWTAHVLAVLHGGVVALRRMAPLPCLGGLLGTAAAFGLVLRLPVYMLGPAVLFVAYALGSEFPRRRAAVLLGCTEVALVLLLALSAGFPGWDSVVLFAALVAAAWFLGTLARRWQNLARESAERASELEQARNELARHAVAAERLRIARELHDVVAHSMSVIAMHAGAARLAVGKKPEQELAALDVIERASREALAEMRRLVTVLRDEDAGAAARGPAPGVAELHTLVSRVVEAGVTVDVRTEGDLEHVPAGVSLAAYRVVQEALTNVVRHAGATRARLEVQAGAQLLAIRVEDDGAATGWKPAATSGGGHGAIGMRERLELYGGTVSAGPRTGGGWCVEARLPYVTGDR